MKMNFKAYLATIGMDLLQLSKILDVNHSYLSSIATGRLIPGRRLAKDIEWITDGHVELKTKERPKKAA